MTQASAADIRPSPLAGMWYPANADALRTMLGKFLDSASEAAPETSPGRLLGLLTPHAGYRFSGPVAAYAFNALHDLTFDTVVIIGPLHYQLPGLQRSTTILTTGHKAYGTPLGQVPVDQDVLAALNALLSLTPLRDDPEHSIEIQLPFLQQTLKRGFSFVPLMLYDQGQETARRLGAALEEALRDRQALLVASSDLSHYYPQKVANQLDAQMLECVEAMDAERVIAYDENGTAFACGHGAIAAVIYALQQAGGAKAHIVRYATSGDTSGDTARVVGYGAATFRAV